MRSASASSKVVSPGRRLVRRIIQALTGIKRGQYVRLEAEICILRFTAVVWFLDEWNRVGILPELKQFRIETNHMYSLSDTLDSWGCAAVWDKRWLQ